MNHLQLLGVSLLAFGLFATSGGAVDNNVTSSVKSYGFDGPISRPVLENYLSRSMVIEGMLNGHGDLNDTIRMIQDTGTKYVGRALCLWNAETDFDRHIRQARAAVPQVLAVDPEIVLEGCVFETVTPKVNQIKIPNWVFTAFQQPVTNRTFQFQ